MEDFAQKAGLSQDVIQAIESGERAASFEEADALATATGANIFDLYSPADGQPTYRGNRSIHSAPVSGHEFEWLTEEQRHQRELEGWSDRERKLGELESLESWHAWATPEARQTNLRSVRRMRELRTELYGSPTGQRGRQSSAVQPPQEQYDVVRTSRGPQPLDPIGGEL